MPDVAVTQVRELCPDARSAVQRLIGRKLRDEEQVSIRVSSPHPAPNPKVRRAAALRLERVMDRAAEKAKHIPDKELEKLIDEAIGHVRRRKR